MALAKWRHCYNFFLRIYNLMLLFWWVLHSGSFSHYSFLYHLLMKMWDMLHDLWARIQLNSIIHSRKFPWVFFFFCLLENTEFSKLQSFHYFTTWFSNINFKYFQISAFLLKAVIFEKRKKKKSTGESWLSLIRVKCLTWLDY